MCVRVCVCVHEPAVPGCSVHSALLTPHHIVVNVSRGKSHACHRHRFGFIVHKFHGLLHTRTHTHTHTHTHTIRKPYCKPIQTHYNSNRNTHGIPDALALKLISCCVEQWNTVYLSDSTFDSVSLSASSADCVDSVLSVVYLRLGEHVQTPGAHPAVCRHSDQVVGILGADHVYAVHWVLHTHTKRDKDTQNGGPGWRYALAQYNK